jgi:hypothetical protein
MSLELTPMTERIKVIEVVNKIEGKKIIEYELAHDQYNKVFTRLLGSTDADWMRTIHDADFVRRYLVGGGTVGEIIGKHWTVIIPPGGGIGRAYDHDSI